MSCLDAELVSFHDNKVPGVKALSDRAEIHTDADDKQ